MDASRQWLSWHEPCLPQAAAWLVDRHAKSGACDLRSTLCVLPGARAGRLLLAELLRICRERGARLHPPRVLTPGTAVDEILADVDPALAIASDFESRLAWTQALQQAGAHQLQPLFPRASETETPAVVWRRLARTLSSVHESLAGDLKTFEDAASAVSRLGSESEAARWQAMASVREAQRTILRRLGLWDRHDSRLRRLELAIENAAAPASTREIVVIGVSDLNALQKATLRLRSQSVISLVHAPESEAEAFDDLGAIREEVWSAKPLNLDDALIEVVERPPHQAQAVVRFISRVAESGDREQVTIGLADANLWGDLAAACLWAGLPVHNPTGAKLSRSAPFRLLEAAADWIEHQRFEHLAALLRHPDVERWVFRTARVHHPTADDAQPGAIADGHVQWLTLLDEYFNKHLQGRLTETWLGDARTAAQLQAAHRAVHALFKPLISGDLSRETRRPVCQWCQPMLNVLADAYAVDDIERDSTNEFKALPTVDSPASIDAALAMRDVLASIAASETRLHPEVTAIEALRLLLEECAVVDLTPEREPDSIEALGWLELHLDTAPALTIMGVNDGAVPEAVVGHAFLPDGLRSALGMTDNRKRLARDAYQLQAIVNSRRAVHLIVGRRSAPGDPLTPSRLLLSCDDDVLVRRMRWFSEDCSGQSTPGPIGLPRIEPKAASGFIIPELPSKIAPPDAMRVTDFALYLKCPFRYALARLVNLEAMNDGLAELDPLAFGSLTHEVLSSLALEPQIASSRDVETIFGYLAERLRAEAAKRFGEEPVPAVRLQIAHMQQRLRSFAEFQAQQSRAGWRIMHCEIAFKGEVALDVSGQDSMPLRGQIDRIDFNERENRWRVIDYKTGESARSPWLTHHNRKSLPRDIAELTWVDLQLPLYHLLVTRGSLGLPAERVELGYVVLPKQTAGVAWHLADWPGPYLDHGIEQAREVVRRIRAGDFARNEDVNDPFDDFARICQTAAFRSADGEDDNGEVAE